MRKFRLYLIASLSAIGVISAATVGIMNDVFPWQEKRGEISLEQVCRLLAEDRDPVSELEASLPFAREYIFDENARVSSGLTYSARCSISSPEEGVLVSVGVAMYTGNASGWMEHLRRSTLGTSRDKEENPFDLGDLGVINETFSGALVPCLEAGREHVKNGSLSVTVLAKFDPSEKIGKSIKASLANHAKSAAKFAHEEARCETQFAVPSAE